MQIFQMFWAYLTTLPVMFANADAASAAPTELEPADYGALPPCRPCTAFERPSRCRLEVPLPFTEVPLPFTAAGWTMFAVGFAVQVSAPLFFAALALQAYSPFQHQPLL